MAVVDYSNAAGAYLNAGDEKRAREARNRAESLEMETGFSRLRHVIGAVGLVASGKDALIERLSTRFGIPVLSTGDITRDLAEQDGLGPPTRDTLHAVSKTYIARFGPDYFPRRLIERIAESDWETVSITGLRTPEDIRALRDHFGDRFILVYVEVTDDSLRFERARMRGTARDPKTIGELKAQDQAEEELFHLSETFQLADVKMNNDGPLEEFYEQIDGLAQNLGLSPK
jgi:dephospho-CoA kinase